MEKLKAVNFALENYKIDTWRRLTNEYKIIWKMAVLIFTFMVLPFFAVASSEIVSSVQSNKNSQVSNNKNRQTQDEPIITNEAEYAEALQRQANQSSAVKTSKAAQNKSAKSNSALQSSSQSSQSSN